MDSLDESIDSIIDEEKENSEPYAQFYISSNKNQVTNFIFIFSREDFFL